MFPMILLMSYLYFKALHIIFVVTWFAGLFYLPRLFIYFAEAQGKNEEQRKALQDQFKIMQKRLWYGITWPSCILAIVFGFSMIHQWFPLIDHPWLLIKLTCVLLLFLYHLSLGIILKQQQKDFVRFNSDQLRLWNEVSTLFLISIVFLVVLKNVLDMLYGLIGLVLVMVILFVAIKVYKKVRNTRA